MFEPEYPNSFARAVTREHRAAYVLLLDLSRSMNSVIDYNNGKYTMLQVVAKCANTLLQELYMRSNSSGEPRNYFDIAILCYSGNGVQTIHGSLENPFVAITELDEVNALNMRALTPLDHVEDYDALSRQNTLIAAGGHTPMYEMYDYLKDILSAWCAREENRESVPPVVINITDGYSSDCDSLHIVEICNEIKSIQTNDGGVLSINIQLSNELDATPTLFPTDEEMLSSRNYYLRSMGRASSIMPNVFLPLIHELRPRHRDNKYRGIGCNTSVVDLISMMNIGTTSVEVR